MKITINENAPVKSRNQIAINASIDSVWEILTNINNWKTWQKDVSKAVIYGEVKEGTHFDWKAGGLSFKSEIHTSIPKSMFGWTGTTLGTSAIHNWFFKEEENVTIVRVEESLQGILPKLFTGFFQKNLDSGVVKNLNELKAAAEKNNFNQMAMHHI
jgi:uncharacterized membrane protein